MSRPTLALFCQARKRISNAGYQYEFQIQNRARQSPIFFLLGSSRKLVAEIKTPYKLDAQVLMLRSFNQNFQFSSNFSGKLKKQSVFNTSSTRKRVHNKTLKNALACASSLY